MQTPPPPPLRRGGTAQTAETFLFEARLDDEEITLDAMVASMTRGALAPSAWERLCAAAQRDERMSELAFAFESVSQGKRVKGLPPGMAAEFFFQAGRFFGEAFNDEVGAITYLERALTLSPTHPGAFAKLEQFLRNAHQTKKLAELYATIAQNRPRAEQAALLARSAELLSSMGGADDKVIDLLQHVLKITPGDEQTRVRLEELCIRANRLRDVVRLNEQALAAEPPPDDATRRKLLARIVEVYADKLHEPERAMLQVEQLLSIDPANEQGRKVAERLVVVKGLAGRAAAALANAYEAAGTPQDVARYLAIELENTRGPKRASLLARLGKLRQERLRDEAGAFEALEQALAIDATDDDLREAYVGLARKLGRHADAAKTLARVLATVKSPEVKAMASAQLGETLLRGGDVKRARSTLTAVLALAECPAEAALMAAYALAEIHTTEKDGHALCEVLDRIASLEPDPAKRQAVDDRLADLATQLRDAPRAIAAFERLLTTSSRPRALAGLAPLYEAASDPEKHARLLEEQAKDTADPDEARARMMRAAQVRATSTSDAAAAIASCHAITERFGPALDVLGLLLPLLETQRRWPDLAQALTEQAELSEGAERVQVLTRIGALRLQRLSDIRGAVDALAAALAVDATDKTARMMLEKLTVIGEHRLAAARVLEPVYREQGAHGFLLKMLELRGALAEDVDERLSALREAVDLAEGAEAGRAAEVVGRALVDAVAYHRSLGEWLARLDAVADRETDAKRRATILGNAIGERAVESEDLSTLAKLAAEAHAACGDAQTAIGLYRRALSFEPHSTELLSKIDDLLRDQGSPRERIALYRAALASGGAARRKELLHRIGAIERNDLGDIAAAISTYRSALEEDADDADAQAALGELYAQAARWGDLCELLEARLGRVEGEAARATRATLASVATAHGDQARARLHCASLLEDPALSAEHLDAVADAAAGLGDPALQRAVLLRRAEMAGDSREQILWLDRLGELEAERCGDLERAAWAWKRAAGLAETGGDDDVARRLYWRARKVAPDDREVAARLVGLCERAQSWQELPVLYVSLADRSADDAERVDLWLRTARVLAERLGDGRGAAARAALAFELVPSRTDVLAAFEQLSIAAGTTDAFEQAVGAAIARLEGAGSVDPETLAHLVLSRARALAADPARLDDAAAVYRAILGRDLDRAHALAALAAFEMLIARDPDSPARRSDRRWVLGWRAEHAGEEERVARFLDWAREEETTASAEPAHALALYRKVLDIDADNDEALSAVARLAMSTGDTEAALVALRMRRDRAEGPARVAVDLNIAQVILSSSHRWEEALASLGAVLAEVPNDPTARALAGQLLGRAETRAETIRILERACDEADDPEERAQILTRLLETRPVEPRSGVDEAEARRGWFERLCDLQRDGGLQEEAMATAIRAAGEMPDADVFWDRAENLVRALSRPEDVAALYEQVLGRSLTRDQALRIGERAVQFYEEWFEDPSRVVRVLERVLVLDPTADWAFDRLKLLLDSSERWDDLFALYDRALESATDDQRATLLEDAAQTAKDFADRPDRAIQYLEKLGELRPDDNKLNGALERLYERTARHRDLVGLLTARLPGLGRDEVRRTRARIAALWLDQLTDPSAALDALEPVLEPTEEPANGISATDLWALLERILAAAPPTPERRSSAPASHEPERRKPRRGRKSDVAPPSVRQRTAGWLREHYTKAGRDADLVRMLLVELEAVRSPKERVRRHLEIAGLYEALGELGNALEQVGAASLLDAGDEGKRAKLFELAERTGRLDRLSELLVSAADGCDDKALRVTLTMQAGALRADRIGDAAGAIALFAAVLATPKLPDDEVLAAGRRLEALLESAGRAEQQLDVVERVAGVEPDAETRRQALGRAARLASRLGQSARAVGLWEQRVLSDPRDAEALDGLVALLELAEPSERFAEVLALRAESSVEPERSRADRVRVAVLLGGPLRRAQDAITAWRAIERDFGEADDADVAQASLLRSTAQWEELGALLQRSAKRSSDRTAQGELLRQLGDVHRVELHAPAAAVETYGLALSSDPHNEGARAGLLSLADDEGLRPAAIAVLLDGLRACDDWRSLLALLPHRLLAAGANADRIEILRETARIAETRAGDTAAAFDGVRRALLLAPGDEEVEREATRLAEASGAWQGLVDTYREAIEGAAHDDRMLVNRLRARAGAILETRLDDARQALAAYLQVVAEVHDVAAGCAAVRVAGKLADFTAAAGVVVDIAKAGGASSAELLDAYESAAADASAWDRAAPALAEATRAAAVGGAAGRDIEARVAAWHRDRRGDADQAEAALVRALAHDDTDLQLLVMLVELQRRDPGRRLIESLLALSRATGGDLGLLREAAAVARDAAKDVELARTLLRDLLSLARERWAGEMAGRAAECAEWAIETLANVHEERGDLRSVVDVLVEGDALPFDLPLRRGMRRRAARIALDRLGDHERAIGLYLALFDDDAHDVEAAHRLASTYSAQGRSRELLRLRERQIDAGRDALERIALRLDAARLLLELGEGARAVEFLRQNLGEDPRHEATVHALAAALESQGLTRALHDLLVDQAQLAQDADDRGRAAELWWRAAVVAEVGLTDLAHAEGYHTRVAAIEPRPASLDALGRLASGRGDPAAAAQWLEQLAQVVEGEARVGATLRLADALVAAGAADRAADRLEQTLASMPEAQPLRERLATLYRDRRDWWRLGTLVTDAAAHAPDKTTRLARLLEAARIFLHRCARADMAIPLLEQASDLAPDDQSVRLALADALAQAERFEDARTILKALVDAFGGRRPKERAPVHYQIARLELAMGNRARALVELDTASRVDPQNPDILRSLAELARDDGQLERAEKSYRALLVVLRRRDDAGSGLGVARSEVLLELSAIAGQQGEGERAREILESALEAAAKSDFEQDRLESTLRARGSFDTLARVLEAKLARIGDSAPAAAKTLSDLAEVLVDHLGRPDQALPVRIRGVASDPGSDAAHQAALELARSAGEPRRYVDGVKALVDRAIERDDRSLACALLARLGSVAEHDLGDPAAAAASYERAAELGLRTPEVLRALDRVFGQLGDTAKQAGALAMLVDVERAGGGPGASSDAVYRLAALRLGSRDTLDEGVQMLRAALDADPQYDRAEEALRFAVTLRPTHLGALDLYERVGRQPGHERALLQALKARSELPDATVDTVRDAVELAGRIGERGLAEALLQGVIDGASPDPSGDQASRLGWAFEALAVLRHAAGDLTRAVELKQAAARLADPLSARRLLFEAAHMAADELGDGVTAARMYEELHRGDPTDRDAWEPLSALYRKLGESQKLADLLASIVDHVEDAAVRGRLRLERVRAMQALGLTDAESAPLLREIVDEDGSQVEAAWMLAGIFERSGADAELVELLSRQIDAAKDRGDTPSIASLSSRLGVLLERTEPPRARDVYYVGLEWEPRSRELLDALARLLGGESDAAERADVLERRLALEEGPGCEARALDLSALRVQLGDEAGAQRALEAGFRGHPASVALRERLEATFRARGEWRQLAELCESDAGARSQPAERIARLQEAAGIWRTKLEDAPRAAAAMRQARESDLDDVALLRDHVDVLMEGGDVEGALGELTRAIGRCVEGDPRRPDLLAARANVRSLRGDETGAVEDLEGAFSTEPAHYAADLAAQIERARAAAAGDPGAVRALRLRQAHVLAFAGNIDRCRTVLIELVKQEPRDRDALRELAALETRLERWDAASAALKRLVGLEEGERAVEVALQLADACERAGRTGDARGALERARVVAPHERPVRDRLAQVYDQTGAWHELSDLVLEDARASGDVADRFALLLRAGSVLLERAGDTAAAIDALEEARALRPLDPECVALLADAYTQSGRGHDAVALLEPVVLAHKGRRARELAPLYWRLARAARFLDQVEGETRAMAQALECDAQSGQVCSDVALRAMELDELDLALRALRAVSLMKAPEPMSKALAYQYMGEIAKRQGDGRRALALLNRALVEDPSLEGARALVDAIERDA